MVIYLSGKIALQHWSLPTRGVWIEIQKHTYKSPTNPVFMRVSKICAKNIQNYTLKITKSQNPNKIGLLETQNATG